MAVALLLVGFVMFFCESRWLKVGGAIALGGCQFVVLAASSLAGAQQSAPPTPAAPMPAVLQNYSSVTAERLLKPEDRNWLMVRRTYDGWGFSPLAQITPQNVKNLKPAWIVSTGVVSGHEAPPIVNDGVMFVATPNNQVMALDEIGNLAPLPSLPVLMAEGGGTGITTMPVLQSLSQARNRWGEHAANTIWDAAIVKIILGGASASKDLQELSVLIGERDEQTESITIGDHGSKSLQRNPRRVPMMPPDQIGRAHV